MALCHRNTGSELTGFMALSIQNNQLTEPPTPFSKQWLDTSILTRKGNFSFITHCLPPHSRWVLVLHNSIFRNTKNSVMLNRLKPILRKEDTASQLKIVKTIASLSNHSLIRFFQQIFLIVEIQITIVLDYILDSYQCNNIFFLGAKTIFCYTICIFYHYGYLYRKFPSLSNF